MKIPEAVEFIINQLKNHGYEAFAVGGCVRDTLLHREPGDWDITTSAKPEQVKQVFPRTIDTGIQHGTVTIMMNHVGYEVTTYRIDGEYEDGRHPKSVEFTGELVEDLKRRDFTINAMAYSHETGIVDKFGGVEDLERKLIRCVGNPMDRFTEDALRILRAIRFSAQLGFDIEPETRHAISVIAPNMVHVSKERIQVELTKLLLSDHPQEIRTVFETGISVYVSDSFARIPVEKVNISTALKAFKHLRWAAFLKDVTPEEAVKVLRDLKLDNDTINRVRVLVKWWRQPVPLEKPAVRRVMSQMEPELFDDLLDLKETLCPEPQTAEELLLLKQLSAAIREAGDCVELKHLAVTGSDLIQAGIKPGKAVGEILRALLEQVMDAPEKNEKECLLAWVKEYFIMKQ